MPTYFYTAKSLKGEPKSGEKVAKDKHELAQLLKKEGYILISAILPTEKPKKTFSISLPFRGVSLAEKMLFTRNLGVMIGAGIPLPTALRTLANQTRSKKLASALEAIASEISQGKSFSEGLSHYPKIFSELFQNMVKVGEESGTLEDVLKTLNRQMEREHLLITKVKGAMVYPAVIIVAMLGIGIMMMIMVVPQLADTFAELNVELPLTTQLVIGTASFLAKFWYLLPIILLALFFICKVSLSTKLGKKLIDTILLKIPIVSSIIKKTNSARTVRALSSLIASAVPIVRSLEIVAGSLSNIYFKKAMLEAAEKVKKGQELAEAMRPYQNIYSPLVVQMIEVGEETGQMADILEKLAQFFEEEVSEATKNLSSVIEPVLMIIIGAVVGFFAVSMIQPMYSMLGTL